MDFSNPLYILISILGALLLVTLLWLIRLELKWRAAFRGKDSKNIEGIVIGTQKNLERLAEAHADLLKQTGEIDIRVKKSIRGIGTIRFNPFKGTSGSNQSFATALINEKGDGVVISSLYSRERVSVFAKPLKDLGSKYELSEEEQLAVKEALKSQNENA